MARIISTVNSPFIYGYDGGHMWHITKTSGVPNQGQMIDIFVDVMGLDGDAPAGWVVELIGAAVASLRDNLRTRDPGSARCTRAGCGCHLAQ